MSLVTLVSGGMDSTLMAVLAKEEGIPQCPLFIDYGQLSAQKEWQTCRTVFRQNKLPDPVRMNLSDFGHIIPSGLTNPAFRLNEDAFLPGRNLLFLLAGAGYAYHLNAKVVAIGLLDEKARIFPDQTSFFLKRAESLLQLALGRRIALSAPLITLSKRDVMELARVRGIVGTYSCHSGKDEPCGVCVSCLEIAKSQSKGG